MLGDHNSRQEMGRIVCCRTYPPCISLCGHNLYGGWKSNFWNCEV